MDIFFSIILDLLLIVGIIVFGSFVIVLVSDLILCLFDDHQGIIFNRNKVGSDRVENVNTVTTFGDVEKKDDIVVYSSQANPNPMVEEVKTTKETNGFEYFDGDKVESIDYGKAEEERRQQQARMTPPPRKVAPEPVNDEIFWDDEDDDDFNDILDEVVKEAKKFNNDDAEQKVKKEDHKADEETQKALEELKALKEQQEKEIEEFRKMKEDFAREKEEQLALLKENLDKAKSDEIEKIKQEAIHEQEKIEELQQELEEETSKEPEVPTEVTEIVKETIIKDEEELNKLKYKNLVRMNSRLTRIIRDTERLQRQKQEEQFKIAEEKRRLAEKEIQLRQKEQERIAEIQLKNQERLLKQQEILKKKEEIGKKLNNLSGMVSKYKLDTKKVVKVPNEQPVKHHIVEEVVTTVEHAPVEETTEILTSDKAPMVATAKPMFDKEYYDQKLVELEEELREAEKDLRQNKAEYIPLTRIYKAFYRDSDKLRKKEIQVAKQKVALYGVKSTKVDPNKKAKLDENLQALAELKDSVEHCEEVIKKNKDRYPVLEKNNKLIIKHIERINADIKVCEKALSYYKKNSI